MICRSRPSNGVFEKFASPQAAKSAAITLGSAAAGEGIRHAANAAQDKITELEDDGKVSPERRRQCAV